MADDQERPENEINQGGIATTQNPNMDRDWDKDAFPTSARPVFSRTALLVVAIAVLCTLVYYSSDHDEEGKESELRRKAAQSEFLGEEVDEGTGAQTVDPGQ